MVRKPKQAAIAWFITDMVFLGIIYPLFQLYHRYLIPIPQTRLI